MRDGNFPALARASSGWCRQTLQMQRWQAFGARVRGTRPVQCSTSLLRACAAAHGRWRGRPATSLCRNQRGEQGLAMRFQARRPAVDSGRQLFHGPAPRSPLPAVRQNRGAVPRAGGRRPGPGPHTGGTHIQHTYVQAHVSGSLRAGTRRQGHGRHRRTYCQGGDSDWAALRALRAVEARPGSWAKIASTHESGISFGRPPPPYIIRGAMEAKCMPESGGAGVLFNVPPHAVMPLSKLFISRPLPHLPVPELQRLLLAARWI